VTRGSERQLVALRAILQQAAGVATPNAFPIFEYERGGRTIREDTGETALLRPTGCCCKTMDKEALLEWLK
jgi:hypothetical protein